MKHLLAIGGIVLVLVGLTAGCGGSNHNDQDVSFAKDMVPHHQQAVTMTDLAMVQTTNPQILDLATRIKAAQAPEISRMNGWLTSWKEKPTDHGGMDMGNMQGMAGMQGMVSDADMRTLGAANGAEFDRLFLQRMTSHHQGAVTMAKDELAKGKYGPAKQLAQEITSGQEKEIAEMAQLLSAPRPAAP